jgi:hypothetical protein
MPAELGFLIGLIRVALVVFGIALTLAAWFSRDEMWSIWYWIAILRGEEGRTEIHNQQYGGIKRAKYILIGCGMVILGITFPWLLRGLT